LDDGELPLELLYENICHSEQSEEPQSKELFYLKTEKLFIKIIPQDTIINKPISELPIILIYN
jgi:hypothetical protein